MKQIEIVLTDHQIEALLNGKKISKEINGVTYIVREHYVKSPTAPIIDRPIKAVNTDYNKVVNKHYFNHLTSGMFNNTTR